MSQNELFVLTHPEFGFRVVPTVSRGRHVTLKCCEKMTGGQGYYAGDSDCP